MPPEDAQGVAEVRTDDPSQRRSLIILHWRVQTLLARRNRGPHALIHFAAFSCHSSRKIVCRLALWGTANRNNTVDREIFVVGGNHENNFTRKYNKLVLVT